MTAKLLLFDFDDTLLTSQKTITAETVCAIRACSARGMLIGYVTGRARPMIGEVFFTEQYQLPKDFVAYYNGAEIYAGDVSIESNAIPYEAAMKTVLGIYAAYPDAKIGVYHEPWSYLKRSGCSDGENWNIETGEKVTCLISELPHYDAQRIRVEFGENDGRAGLKNFMTEESIFFINADGSAMIISKNATKEHALKKAAEYFDITPLEIVAFGDDINDIEMLKAAGIGVAMGNAIDKLKEVADFVTGTNDEEGISSWINKYLLP